MDPDHAAAVARRLGIGVAGVGALVVLLAWNAEPTYRGDDVAIACHDVTADTVVQARDFCRTAEERDVAATAAGTVLLAGGLVLAGISTAVRRRA